MAQILAFPAHRIRRRSDAEILASAAHIAPAAFDKAAEAAHMARAERIGGLILKIEDALSHAALTGDDPALPPVSWYTGRDFRRQTNLQLVIRGFKGREIHILDGEDAAMLGRALFADPGEAGCAEIGARLLAIGDAITAMNAPLVRGEARVRAALEVARQSANHLTPDRPNPPRWPTLGNMAFAALVALVLLAIVIDTAARAGVVA